jgi:hypothetical protein
MCAFVIQRLPWQSSCLLCMNAPGSAHAVPRGHGPADSLHEDERSSDARSLTGIPNLQGRMQRLEPIHEFRFATGPASLEDQVVLKEAASLSSDLA